jgi:hypothetical protein
MKHPTPTTIDLRNLDTEPSRICPHKTQLFERMRRLGSTRLVSAPGESAIHVTTAPTGDNLASTPRKLPKTTPTAYTSTGAATEGVVVAVERVLASITQFEVFAATAAKGVAATTGDHIIAELAAGAVGVPT